MRKLRIIVAAFVFGLFFIGSYGITRELYNQVQMLQIGPMFIRVMGQASILTLLFFLFQGVAAMVFGRWYCSFFCPLGVSMDMVMFLRNFVKKYRFKYRKSAKFRWIIFFCSIGSAAVTLAVFSFLEPFSLFSRFSDYFKSPSLSLQGVVIVLAFIVILLTTLWRGRLFCNLFCPVGAFLGLLGRNPVLAIRFNKECVRCGMCENICKANAIDHKAGYVDMTKCVLCFNCLGTCKFDALRYERAKSGKVAGERRMFLKSLSGLALGLAAAYAAGKTKAAGVVKKLIRNPLPPGAKSLAHLKGKCISCRSCVKSCPVKIIKIDWVLPYLDFEDNFCQFDCQLCTESCPTNALGGLGLEEKQKTKIGEADLHIDICIVRTKHEACGACAEHCPTGALTMVVGETGLPEPVLDKSLCIGCGGCTYICPVRPQRAIVVDGVSPQTVARQLEKKADNIIEDTTEGFAF